MSQQDVDTARAQLVQTKYSDELMRKPHVVGVGVGLLSDGRVGLVVMVDEESPEAQIPTELDGVPVEVRAIGQPRAF
jgi:hypothetical protein